MNTKPTPDEPNPLRKLFHPKWLGAFKQAVRTRGEQGWSQMFDSLRLCPGCGEELMVRRNGTFYYTIDGEVDDAKVDDEELYCPECNLHPRSTNPLHRTLEGCREEAGDLDVYLDLGTLNSYLVAEWFDGAWRPRPELTEACLLGNPLALLYYELAGEAHDEEA